MLIYLQRNYDFPDLFQQTPNRSGKWKELQFTFDPVKKCDYVVVLNRPRTDIRTTCLHGGKIIVVQEPPYERNNYFKLHFRFYDTIVSGFRSDEQFQILNTQASLPWHVGKTYDELSALTKNKLMQKMDKVSWITSNLALYPQHKNRLAFIDHMKEEKYDFDLFGRGFEFIQDKFDGIYPYKYTIAAENYVDKDYFTEKILDAYLSWSMPIYAGCTNLSDYFPAESFVSIDLNFPKEALEKIRHAVANKLWEKNIDAIGHARELILNKYQLFPMLHDLITSGKLESVRQGRYDKVFIPSSGLTKTEELKNKIKKLIPKL